ncbi:MAG: hypothetical protein WCA35_00375 [Kovacikia sp.]
MQPLVAVVLLGLTGYVLWLIWRDSRKTVNGVDRNLLSASRGDDALARRLLAYNKGKYPGKSEQWCVEKAIYDLKRDQHRH